MATKAPESTGRKPRADAQRNRERILEEAKKEFTKSGANNSLEEIAKKAGVGPGTLYRHFPTREELLVAVYPLGYRRVANVSAGPDWQSKARGNSWISLL